MGWADRARVYAEERLGVSIVEREELDTLREGFHFLETFKEDARELAYQALDAFGGNRARNRLPLVKRQRLAERSRDALMDDPLAGAEADLLANFSFGKGVAIPDAEDDRVQEVIEEAWTDPVNQAKLTSFEAQRHRSHELLAQANLYPTAFIRGGKVRLGFLDADRVREVICDPDDDERPLWYVYEEPLKPVWNFDEDRYYLMGEAQGALGPPEDGERNPIIGATGGRIVYYPHWRNVEDVRKERRQNGLQPIEEPPKERIGAGLVEHIRINRIGRTQFGTPPWARTLRFYTAMNNVTEAHVSMAQARSSIIAKRSTVGSPSQITKTANSILAQTGELGAARFGSGEAPLDMIRGGQVPPAAGSFWVENQSDKLEAVNLSSGAAEAMQTSQIVRAPIAAASGFGQHYLGDASSANLATATSLELPTLMTVQAWQETHGQMVRWFVDLVIQTALRAGRLGGGAAEPTTSTPLSELHVQERDERQEAETRTGKKLGYKFAMPYPGRRNLPDVASLVVTVKGAFDATGQNIPLQRQLLLFLAQYGLEVDDPRAWVDEVLPEEAADAVARQALAQQLSANANGAFQQQQQQDAMAAAQMGPGSASQGDPATGPSGEAPANAQKGALMASLEELQSATDDLFVTELERVLTGV